MMNNENKNRKYKEKERKAKRVNMRMKARRETQNYREIKGMRYSVRLECMKKPTKKQKKNNENL